MEQTAILLIALQPNMQAVMASFVSCLSAAVGGLTWVFLDYRHEKKYSALGLCVVRYSSVAIFLVINNIILCLKGCCRWISLCYSCLRFCGSWKRVETKFMISFSIFFLLQFFLKYCLRSRWSRRL